MKLDDQSTWPPAGSTVFVARAGGGETKAKVLLYRRVHPGPFGVECWLRFSEAGYHDDFPTHGEVNSWRTLYLESLQACLVR